MKNPNLDLWLTYLVDNGNITMSEAVLIMENQPPPEIWQLSKKSIHEKEDVCGANFIKGSGIFGKEIQKIILRLEGGKRIVITSSEWLLVQKQESE